tara:strand:- start:163 stop:1341 length:1179 start_codon:yes stop_codon:yes gene_type:complete
MAYRSKPKDWIAYYNFYISIALLSLWEAMTAQSLSKMANTKDNFLWNIEKKIEKDTTGEWESIEKLFKAFFSANEDSEVDKDDDDTRVMLESLDTLMKRYDPISNLTKTVKSTNIKELLNDIQNIETNVTLLGITIKNSEKDKKKKEEMDKFLNGKELINENIYLSFIQVGTFFIAVVKALQSLLELGEQKSVVDDSISTYFEQLIDAANKIEDSQYNNITNDPPKIENSNTFTGRSKAGFSLYFGWIVFFVIMIVSQFTDKESSVFEVVVFFIICGVWLIQYTMLNPALKEVISIELINFPKILTFLIFCMINSVIAALLMEMIRNDKTPESGVYVLTTEGKKWRYGEWWGIIVSSIGSLALGWLLFQLLPSFFTSTKYKDAESKQKQSDS